MICERLARLLPAPRGEEPYGPEDWHHHCLHPNRLRILQGLHAPLPDLWSRIVSTEALHAGTLRDSIYGKYIRFELRRPIPASHDPESHWYVNIETPTVEDIYLQPWCGRYIQRTLEPGEKATAFHVTKLEYLVSGNTLAGPASKGILQETASRHGIAYKGGLRAGANGHSNHYGVFVLNYFPGPYWCTPGTGSCICEVEVVSATTVKSGSLLRSCADDEPLTLSTKTCLKAIVVPSQDVPSPVLLH